MSHDTQPSATGDHTPPVQIRSFTIGTGPVNEPDKREVYTVNCSTQLDLENTIMDEVVNFLEGMWGFSQQAIAKACKDTWSNSIETQPPIATIFYGEERGSKPFALTIVEVRPNPLQEQRRLYDRLIALEDTTSSTDEDVFFHGLFSRADLRALKAALIAPSARSVVDEIRLTVEDDDSGERILTPELMSQLDELATGTRLELSL